MQLSGFSTKKEDLAGQRLMLFSYGSGLASSLYSLRVSQDTSPDSALSRLMDSLADLTTRLNSRAKVPPAEFSQTMKLREDTHHLGELSLL